MADEIREFARHYEFCAFTKGHELRVIVGLHTEKTFQVLNIDRNFLQPVELLVVPAQEFLGSREWTPLIPFRGWFNTTITHEGRQWNVAVYCNFVTKTQYKKGFGVRGDPSFMTAPTESPTGSAARKHVANYLAPIGMNLNNLAIILAASSTYPKNKIFPTFHTAIDWVESFSPYESVAFSRRFAIALHKEYTKPILYFDRNRIGVIDNYVPYVLPSAMHLSDFFEKRWQAKFLPIDSHRKFLDRGIL